MASLYQEIIFKHYRHPLHKGKLKNPTRKFAGANPFCGDELNICVKLDSHRRVKKVAWEGKGCALSQAAASIFTDMMKGKTLSQIKKIKSSAFLKKLDIELSPARIKCVLLPLYTIKEEDIEEV